MSAADKDTDKKDPRGGLKNFRGKRHELTKDDSSKGGKKTADLNAIRKKRAEELSTTCPADAAADLWNAVQKGDLDKVKCYEIAYKIAGLSSEKSGSNTFNMNGPSQFLFGFKKIEPTQKDE